MGLVDISRKNKMENVPLLKISPLIKIPPKLADRNLYHPGLIIVSRGHRLSKPANTKVENNGAVVGSFLTLHNPLLLLLFFFSKIVTE